ncbi:MAG: aldehyde dehydrogenase family protein, partial [Verrucomicrobiota bacterium]
MKKFTLELGGKNPLVILDDADVNYAVSTAVFSNFMHQGQVCMTGSRVIVGSGIYDDFLARFAEKVVSLKAGPPSDPETIIGPLIRPKQCEKIQSIVEDA